MTPLLWFLAAVGAAWCLLFALIAARVLHDWHVRRQAQRRARLDRQIMEAYADAWAVLAEDRASSSPHDQ